MDETPGRQRGRLLLAWALAAVMALAAGGLAAYNTLLGSWEPQPDLAAEAAVCHELLEQADWVFEAVQAQGGRVDAELPVALWQADYEELLARSLALDRVSADFFNRCEWLYPPDDWAAMHTNYQESQLAWEELRVACRIRTDGAEWC